MESVDLWMFVFISAAALRFSIIIITNHVKQILIGLKEAWKSREKWNISLIRSGQDYEKDGQNDRQSNHAFS